jgi:tetratricopeptide (TPR) repeat protein
MMGKSRQHEAGPRRHQRRRHRATAAAFAIAPLLLTSSLVTLLPAPTHAAERTGYTLDNDPVRQGKRLLDSGAWADAKLRFNEAVTAGYHLDEAQFGLGQCALRVGDYAEAEKCFTAALSARGGAWSDPRAELGLLALRGGNDSSAADAFDEALAADGKCWPARYGQALLELKAGRWEKARDMLESGRDRKGVLRGEDRYHHGKALVFLANGAGPQAEVEALQAQTLDPVDPQYTALLARVYQAQGNNDLAINAWEQLLATPGITPDAPTLTELGRLYSKTGRHNDARARFEQAGAADSTYTPALRELADLFRRAKRPEQAARTWLRCVQVAPQDVESRLGLATALRELGRMDEAAGAAKAARDLAPADAVAALLYAQVGLRAGDDAVRADAAAFAATLLAGGAPEGWQLDDQLALAGWQGTHGQADAAQASLTAAAAMDSTSSSVPFQQGLLELRAGRTAEAAERFTRASALDPTSAAAHLNLGIARFQGGDPRAAIADFRAAVALDAKQATARLLLAQALAAVDSLPAAEKVYRDVLAAEPANAKAQRGLGFCRLRAADYPGAARAYEQSTQVEPGNADGWAGLGSANLGQGRLDAAGAAFTKARAIDPQNPMLKTGSELLNQARNAGKEAPSR